MTMAEIKKMQKKLALLEEENIILKKAMAIFSRESGGKSRTDLPAFKGAFHQTSVQSFEGSQKHILQHFKS